MVLSAIAGTVKDQCECQHGYQTDVLFHGFAIPSVIGCLSGLLERCSFASQPYGCFAFTFIYCNYINAAQLVKMAYNGLFSTSKRIFLLNSVGLQYILDN